jgi:hypothetical protein
MNGHARATHRPRPPWAALAIAAGILLITALQPSVNAAEDGLPPPAVPPLHGAGTGAGTVLSPQARQLADWIALTGDHAGAPFIIVDKKRASVFVFEANARLRAHSAVLLGAALGDDSVPGIGTRPMAQILPAERTTPAGRFVAERGRNTQGEDVVWVDYDAAVSMHRVRTGNASERRAERLATPTIDDNRISYGCINVPVAFYESFIQPIFAASKAMVYVLPDTKPVQETFGMLQAAPTGVDATRPAPARMPDAKGLVGDSSGSVRKR